MQDIHCIYSRSSPIEPGIRLACSLSVASASPVSLLPPDASARFDPPLVFSSTSPDVAAAVPAFVTAVPPLPARLLRSCTCRALTLARKFSVLANVTGVVFGSGSCSAASSSSSAVKIERSGNLGAGVLMRCMMCRKERSKMGAEGGRRRCLCLSFPFPDGERPREVPGDASGIGRDAEDALGW